MDEEYVEQVLSLVERIPAGRVTTYGAIADAVGSRGPRQVGRVMSTYGGAVPWWRVVRADGVPPLCHDGVARAHHLEEGTPVRPSGIVDLGTAMWWPPTSGRRASDVVGRLCCDCRHDEVPPDLSPTGEGGRSEPRRVPDVGGRA